MRILIARPGPYFSVADVERGWTAAFRKLGHDVQVYNLDERLAFFQAVEIPDPAGGEPVKLSTEDAVRLAIKPLEAACYRFMPDIIFVVSGFFIPDDLWALWQHRPHRVVYLCTESPYEDDRQLRQIAAAQPSVTLVNDPTNIEQFRAICPNSFYAPHAYDPDFHSPGPAVDNYRCDFGFVGTGYPSRVDLFQQVDWSGINIKLAGMWKNAWPLDRYVIHDLNECFDNADAVSLYRSCRMSANLYRASRKPELEANAPDLAAGWAMGPREVELAACGTFFVREPRGEGDELFPMLPTFTEPAELQELLGWWLTHDREREEAALKAHAAVANRTFVEHASNLMRLLGE